MDSAIDYLSAHWLAAALLGVLSGCLLRELVRRRWALSPMLLLGLACGLFALGGLTLAQSPGWAKGLYLTSAGGLILLVALLFLAGYWSLAALGVVLGVGLLGLGGLGLASVQRDLLDL